MTPDKGSRGPLSMVMGLVNNKTGFVSLMAIVIAVGLLMVVPGSVEGHHRAGHDRGPRAGSEIAGILSGERALQHTIRDSLNRSHETVVPPFGLFNRMMSGPPLSVSQQTCVGLRRDNQR